MSQITHFSDSLFEALTKKVNMRKWKIKNLQSNPKSKKIRNFVEKIPSSININTTLSKAYGISPSHKVKTFSNLEMGENSDTILVGKVLSVIPKQFLPV